MQQGCEMKMSIRKSLQGDVYYVSIKIRPSEVNATLPKRIATHLEKRELSKKLTASASGTGRVGSR
jgi:hypothetical protein